MTEPAALQLRDIHLPSEPGWWPPAIGWWLLLLVAIVMGWQALRLLLRWRRRRHRVRSVLLELARVEQETPLGESAIERLAAYSELLRRACRRFLPDAVALRDDAWLAFLDGGNPSRPFSTGPGRLLIDGPYQRSVDPEGVKALSLPLRRRLVELAEQADA